MRWINGVLSAMTMFGSAYATQVPTPNIPQLCGQSDLIVVGQMEGAQRLRQEAREIRGSSTQVDLIEAIMKVDSTLKGPLADTGRLRFRFLLPHPESLGFRGVPSRYQIVFLKQEDGHWTVANPFYPSLPAVAHIATTNANVVANVLQVLTAALDADETVVTQDDKVRLISALSFLTIPITTNALKVAATSSNEVVRVRSISALLERNETSVMAAAVDIVAHPDSLPGEPWQREELIHSIAAGIGRGVKDPAAIPYLSKLLQVPDVTVRRGAAEALWNMREPAAIPPLVSAMQDGDFEVRYCGVIGLADLSGDREWRPLREDFRDDEERYLSHWKTWASVHNIH